MGQSVGVDRAVSASIGTDNEICVTSYHRNNNGEIQGDRNCFKANETRGPICMEQQLSNNYKSVACVANNSVQFDTTFNGNNSESSVANWDVINGGTSLTDQQVSALQQDNNQNNLNTVTITGTNNGGWRVRF